MKKIFYLIFAISISFQLIFAQDVGNNKSGPVPKLKLERSIEAVGLDQELVSIGYGYSSILQYIMSIPSPCSFTPLAPWSSSGYLSSMCQGGDGNYYVTEANGHLLYQLDTVNITFILLGNITGMGTDQPNGIAYNPVNGNYYIASSSKLFSFDVNTRQATLIGSFNTGGIMIDLCFDENGICYAYDVGTDNGYTIDITTGNANLLGPLGYDANYGQGMSYDYQTSTIYLSAFNNGTFTGQCRIMNPFSGMTTLISDWGYEQIDAFAFRILLAPPCPVSAASNPDPPTGTTGVSVSGVNLSWTNGSGTTNVEVWFGQWGSVTKVYDGTAITSWPTGTLNYFTAYQWRIVCKNDTCVTQGPTWTFTTESDPVFIFNEDFDDLSCWTAIGPFGQTNWSNPSSSLAGGTPPELMLSWSPQFNGLAQLLSCEINMSSTYCINLSLKNFCDWYEDPAPFMGLAITYDNGLTSTILWEFQPVGGNVGPETINFSFLPVSVPFRFILFLNGNSFNIDDWYVDDIQVSYLLGCPPPSPPGNLSAQIIFNPDPKVQLNWQDGSWNEQWFNIFRKYGYPNDPGDYTLIGVAPMNSTQYIDTSVTPESTYTYQVFSYNIFGTNGSNTATITVPIPVELISFTCEVEEDVVNLFWQTATETNNAGFEILRFAQNDNNSWERIGFVEGKGTTTEIQSYSFQDEPELGKYKYRLKQIDFDGSYECSQEIEAEVKPPLVFSLEQNYPNPFNPSTTISWQSPVSSWQTLKVYDVLGNEVATLVDEYKPAGKYEIEFNPESSIKYPASGIYFYQLKTGEFVETKKMLLLK